MGTGRTVATDNRFNSVLGSSADESVIDTWVVKSEIETSGILSVKRVTSISS